MGIVMNIFFPIAGLVYTYRLYIMGIDLNIFFSSAGFILTGYNGNCLEHFLFYYIFFTVSLVCFLFYY